VRILFVTGSLVHGGAERHAITLANRLAERGHTCHFAYVKDDPAQLGRLRLGPRGEVECMYATRYLDGGALLRLHKRIVKSQPTVLVAVNQYALMYATLAARWAAAGGNARAPLATIFHSTLYRNAKERLQMLLYRPFFWAAHRAVFVCEAQRRHWRKRQVFGRRDEVIYNGVDLEHWSARPAEERRRLRAALGLGDADRVIGLSAVLRPEKNPVQLVEALALLRRRAAAGDAPFRALFIGDGPLRGEVEARAKQLGVAADVLVTGFQQDVRPFLAACDVAVLTSFTEAFSLAAIEAMALGLPLVHSEVGGAAEMVRHGRNGFLFPPGDTAALADRLAKLAERGTRERMGARAREAVEAQFSEPAMVDAYERMFLELETTGNGHEDLRRAAGAH
jgi:glycosyltransferase involved in cell wall biosynthesis